MKSITVGVSGINAVDNPGPGVGVARALKEDTDLDVKVVGLAYDAMETGIFMDWLFDKSYVMPYPSGEMEAYIQRLLYIKESFGLDYVSPSLDVELPIYTRFADELAQAGIHCLVPTRTQFKLRGKDRLTAVAERIGIRVPRTEVVTTIDDLYRALDTIGWPAMIKGAFYQACRAHTTQQALACYHNIVAEWGYPVIVQQVVTGDELNVVGVGDGQGGCLGLVGIKKMGTTSLGKIWTGVTIRNQAMLDAARAFIKEYKWRGAFELECMAQGDDIFLIEINPRLPAWSYFAAGLGINLPANMVRQAFGLPVNHNTDYEPGKLYIRYTYEVISDSVPFQHMMTKGEHANDTQL
jgi:carbamoyl-phosphate synthase large subunit